MRCAGGSILAAALVMVVAGATFGADEDTYLPDPGGRYVNVKRDLGAKGDGRTDDTAALQAFQFENEHDVGGFYFPAGTYLVSGTFNPGGKRVFIMGESRQNTVIRLKDNCPGFQNPDDPKPVVLFFEWNIGAGGMGQAFRNSIHNLTIDVGKGNPGAVALAYMNNNEGTVSNVTLRSSDPRKAGKAGLAMATNWPGPALIRNVHVDGFDIGIWSIIHQYSITMEHISLENQRQVGIANSRQKLFIRGLRSVNKVPALQADGFEVILDCDLRGGAPDQPAIKGNVEYARNIKTTGYRAAIDGVAGKAIGERAGVEVVSLFNSPKRSLRLPVKEPPQAEGGKADWVSMTDFGLKPGEEDCTAAIQKAVDSGARLLYLPRDTYTIKGTVRLSGKVERINFMDSRLLTGEGDAPVFRVEDGPSPFVILERFEEAYGTTRTLVEQATRRPVVLRFCVFRSNMPYTNSVKGGDLFLDDVCGGPFIFDHQNVWARQLNPELTATEVTNNGGLLWILGLKTEKSGTAVHTLGGGKTEVLGGYIYYNRGNDGNVTPAFICDESSLSVITTMAGGDGPQIRETRGGETKQGRLAEKLFVGVQP